MLIAGTGSSAIADCLAQPNPDQAAIRYGITGVCHQMANRILHPANVIVDNCRGYIISYLLYGSYGLGPWPERTACYPIGTAFAPGRHGAALRLPGIGAPVANVGQAATTPTVIGNQSASNSVNPATASETVAEQEATEVARLSALSQKALGYSLDQDTLRALNVIQENLRNEQNKLVNLFDGGRISAEEYLSLVNQALAAAMQRNRDLLGEEIFRAIFGEAGENPEGLIDCDVFLKSAHRHPVKSAS